MHNAVGGLFVFFRRTNVRQILTALIVLAVARGILRYLEQMSGHYIAFKLLALLRDKVFSALRRLAFVKLQDKQSGQLLSLVTNDIELLEVFYAHTIAPIAIAFLTSGILLAVFAHISWWFVLVAFLAYVTIGIILPIVTTQMAREDGRVRILMTICRFLWNFLYKIPHSYGIIPSENWRRE